MKSDGSKNAHHFNERYGNAVKPVKLCHFHPDDKSQWDCMVEGKNDLNVKIISKYSNFKITILMKLLKIFN